MVSELDGRIPLVIDGGETNHGLESTIVAVRNRGMEILRPGPVTAETLAAFGEVRAPGPSATLEAPGQLPSHYAPRTPLVLVDSLSDFVLPTGRIGGLAFGDAEPAGFALVRSLSATGDLREAAAKLFHCLRELDAAGLDLIVAERVPEEGLGRAIMDRLQRAAAVV